MDLKINGCALITKSLNFVTLFDVNDTVYLRYKAVKGLLRKITIKKILINNGFVIYVDTLNAMFQEDELLEYVDAVSTAIDYYTQQAIDAQEAYALVCK